MSDIILAAIAGDAAALLHRVEVEDGLDIHVGREAALALLAAWRADADRLVTLPTEDRRHAMVPLPGAHIWARLEAGRIARLVLARTRAGSPEEAADHGAARPVHRPLGELLSGRGQLGAPTATGDDPVAWFTAAWNRRDPGLARHLAPVTAVAPDAVLIEQVRLDERRLQGQRAHAVLFRLLGNAAGRRVSLPLSVLLAGTDPLALAWDGLALAATPHRPFWPD